MVNTLKALKRLGPFQAKQPDTVVYTYFIYQGMSLTPLARTVLGRSMGEWAIPMSPLGTSAIDIRTFMKL